MGVQSIIVGYIVEAWPGAAGGDEEKFRKRDLYVEIGKQTDSVLQGLPEEGEWPPLIKPMFEWPPSGSSICYLNRVIHFSASVKNLDFSLRTWMDKFDDLLKQLYWESAYVRFERGYIGTHEFRWEPKQGWLDQLYKGYVSPITEWNFTSTLDNLEQHRKP